MPFIFILILSLYLGGNIYIFIKGVHVFSHLPEPVGWLLAVLFWVCFLSFLGVFLLRDVALPSRLAQIMQYTGTGWLVFTLYMVVLLLAFDLLRLFHLQVPYSFYISLGITVCTLLYGYIHYKHPSTEVVNIVINKSSTVGKNIKVLGISDVHLGYATNKKQLQTYVEKIMAEKPDLILIAGDLIDNSVTPLRLQHMQEELSRLNAPLGVYMVPGNHEYISGIRDAEEFIRETPIRLLKDSVVVLPNGVRIVGRDDKMNSHRQSLGALMEQVDRQYPVLLLDHQPYHLEEAVEAGIDLQFSGHTHRGQIWPMSLLTDRLFEVSYGYKQKGNSHFYVSSGLSLWGPPFRIGTQSEMVVFELTFGQ